MYSPVEFDDCIIGVVISQLLPSTSNTVGSLLVRSRLALVCSALLNSIYRKKRVRVIIIRCIHATTSTKMNKIFEP